MAVINPIGNTPIRMDQFFFESMGEFGEVTRRDSQSLFVSLNASENRFFGDGFRYNADGEPIGGTITGFTQLRDGATVFSISNLNLSAKQFYDLSTRTEANEIQYGAAYHLMFSGNDSIYGSTGNDFVMGDSGHDYVAGGDGSDVLLGDDGNDHLYGQSPNGGPDQGDALYGGKGSDYIQGNAGNDTLRGGAGSDRIQGGADNDYIYGGTGNDTINGNLGDDTIEAGDGADYIRGGKGDDVIFGMLGRDLILGDLGNDTIFGNYGGDTLTGGEGADVFSFSLSEYMEVSRSYYDPQGNLIEFRDSNGVLLNLSTITDFERGTDKLAFDYLDGSNLHRASFASLIEASAFAKDHYADIVGSNPATLLVAGVGSSTYLFFPSLDLQSYSGVIEIRNLDYTLLNASDFTLSIIPPNYEIGD